MFGIWSSNSTFQDAQLGEFKRVPISPYQLDQLQIHFANVGEITLDNFNADPGHFLNPLQDV
jgi:hypothetical protein